ncbi:MAG: hypothetical protein CMO65_03750, partial [Verrucomicrobiales bacterium]|nr:hypothetical protein [Verrucomicrobiales bacterium]
MPAKKKSPATANRKKPKFRRVLLKISGEVLGGETGGICPESVHDVAAQVREVAKLGVQIGVVVGGGNIFRGLQGSEKGIERVTGDQMGMLATVINSMALQDALEKQGVPTRVQSAITMSQVAEPFIRRRAVRHLEKGRVVIFGGGTGNPTWEYQNYAQGNSNYPNDPNVFFQGSQMLPPLLPGTCTFNGGSAGVFTLTRDSNLDDRLVRSPLV